MHTTATAIKDTGTPGWVKFTIRNNKGMTASFLNYGGCLVSLRFPDKHGHTLELMPDFSDYGLLKNNSPYFGALIGRLANRIKDGRFTLDGTNYQCDKNFRGKHTLHGGLKGFSQYLWDCSPSGENTVVLSGRFADMEDGFPGNLEGTATYSLEDDNTLRLAYHFKCDRKSLLNVTSHPYFNLNGAGSGDVLNHHLKVNASRYLASDHDLINSGEIKDVKGTPFDFTQFNKIGERMGHSNPMLESGQGYDLCYALDSRQPAAEAYSEISGIKLTVSTSQPGIQLYTGNSLDGTFSNGTSQHSQYGYFCLETQHFPGAERHAHFPSAALEQNQPYEHFCAYHLCLI